MPTHAELSAKLLNDAASFFKTLGAENPALQNQMGHNAAAFEQMATLLVKDPFRKIDGQSHASLASKLLIDAASFFRSLAEQNAPLEEQMNENASVFEHMAQLLEQDPLGNLD